MTSEIEKRKIDHLDLCSTDEVAFQKRTTLLECVRLTHQSLPDMSFDDVDTSIEFMGKKLKAPIVIAGMTGGTARAAEVNRDLATIANRRGYAFGLGSQRAMHRAPETSWTYEVRKWAPDVLLFGNMGVIQARDCQTREVEQLVRDIGADAICIHMNPAMEIIQHQGDRDFRGGTETFRRLAEELAVPVIAKETGNGISMETAHKLRSAGVQYVDVSGAGGTSWVGVETLRAEGAARDLGEFLWDWGVPTAASVHNARRTGLTTIATGGIQRGGDVAHAIALGASAAGIARAVFKAWARGGPEAVDAFLDSVERELKAIMLLTASRSVRQLGQAPRVITGELRAHMDTVSAHPDR